MAKKQTVSQPKPQSNKLSKGVSPAASKPFDATWESLRTYKCPKWFRDAKLGIWAHWGPQCAPMHGDWYARNMYIEGSEQYMHHWRTYGHPSKFGYKDIVKLWKAERFDPDMLMDLYVQAGAKYFVAQAVHHDNFDNWKSKHHRWNSVEVGPGKDIVGLWRDAARNRGLRFGVSEHLGATWKWSAVNKGCDTSGPYKGVPYDGNDPAYEDLYLPNKGAVRDGWYTVDPRWHQQWLKRMKDLVNQHHPDLFYSDGSVPFDKTGLKLIAHLYNTSAKDHGGRCQAVYNQKNTDPEVFHVGVLDIERGQKEDIVKYPWQTDTCVGGWFYHAHRAYKTPRQIIETLVDIVSKNGNLLLNILQRPDGTLDDENLNIVKCMAAWIKVNGEGIYGTRPWRVAGEGPTPSAGGAFKEAEIDWTGRDVRFTTKAKKVYAFLMKWPDDGQAVIKNLSLRKGPKVAAVELLGRGDDEKLPFTQSETELTVRLPDKPAVEYAHGLKVVTE